MLNRIAALLENVPFESWHHPTKESCNDRLSVMVKLAELLEPELPRIQEEAIKGSSRIEYCKRSSFYPRGYYYPDPLADIIVSNAPRGSIKKEDPGDAEYAYYFDEKDELSFVVEKEELIDLNSYRTRCEKLYSFNNMRVGIAFLLDDTNADLILLDVLIETRNVDRTEYAISWYSVSSEGGLPFKADFSEVVSLEMLNGLPVKRSETLFINEDFAAAFLGEASAEDDNEWFTMMFEPPTTVYELGYNEKGFPISMKCNGSPCPVGRKKRPVLSGMMK